MTTPNLTEIEEKTVSIDKYVSNISSRFQSKFAERKQSYQLNEEAVEKLKYHAKDVFIVVFSAEWCKDCAANMSVLALIAEKTGLKIRVFGGLKKDILNPNEQWRIPPSPPEVKAFNIQKTPTILVFDKHGRPLGAIVENPKPENTLEEELLQIIHRAQTS